MIVAVGVPVVVDQSAEMFQAKADAEIVAVLADKSIRFVETSPSASAFVTVVAWAIAVAVVVVKMLA